MLMETMAMFSKKRKYFRFFIRASIYIGILILICLLVVILLAKVLGPPPLNVSQSNLFYADDGTVVGESNSGQKRFWIHLDEISPNIVNATIAVEDKTFYKHYGFDLKRMIGAVIVNVKAMKKKQGASTITQQYARALYLGLDKTWKRKITEAFYTLRLEVNYNKEEILEGYLNTIYYGHGTYGIQAASQFYYGKNANELSLAEAAMLAGIPKGPSIYSPLLSEENAKQRQLVVLQALQTNGIISKDEVKTAANQSLHFIGAHTHHQMKAAPYFHDIVKAQLQTAAGFDRQTIDRGGLHIYTTLNTKHQQIAEKVINETISDESDIQVAFTAIQPDNGYVTAMVGGRNYEESPFNRAVQAIRQPGSTIKPLLFYAALEKGFTPTTMMRSEKTTFRFDNDRGNYTPRNFNHQYADEAITLERALALSDNIYAVKTHLFIGEEALINTARQFGLTTEIEKVPSSALGASGVRQLEMVNAYNLFVNGGKQVTPTFIKKVEDTDGNILYEANSSQQQVLNPALASIMTQMMTGMFDPSLNGYATITGQSILPHMTRPYAGKSGSTNKDSWMIGFAPQLTAGVWTGYDKGKDITSLSDAAYAKDVWIRFMEEALQAEPTQAFLPEKGVVAKMIDPNTGKIATKACPTTPRLTYFLRGTEPSDYCSDHLQHKDKQLKHRSKAKKHWFRRLFEWR